MLLVLTHDGRGVIDCLSGIRVARDRNPDFPFNETTRVAQGIGPLADDNIVVAGNIFGSDLPVATDDGWSLAGRLSNSSDDVLSLIPPDKGGVVDVATTFTGFVPEVRVFGFSPTGRSFVIGTGAEVFVFTR